MSALPQPDYREAMYPLNPPASPPEKVVSTSSPVTKTTKLSRKKRSSALLQLVSFAQVSSSVLAGTVMLGSIGVYLTTVRIPQLWSQEYENLENLQRQERQLVAIDEALKYSLAEQATQSGLAMSSIGSQNTVFLPQKMVEPQQVSLAAVNQQALESIPLGY